MNTKSIISMLGLQKIIEDTFSEIVNSAKESSEQWLEKTHILTLGRKKYAEYIVENIATYALFGTSKTTSIDSSYVKVNITEDIERERYKEKHQIESLLKKSKRGTIEKDYRKGIAKEPLEAINQTDSDFVLVGNAGSGKTTSFRYIAVQTARGIKIRGEKRIPIFLSLRDLQEEDSILDATIQQFELFQISHPKEVIELLLKSGKCFLLLDGFDEITKEMQRKLLLEIKRLKAKFPKTILCLSARPYSLNVALPTFYKWETLPLELDDRILFVEKWFNSVDKGKGKRLIEKCKMKPELLDLGSSPLLLSIVCALYYNDLNIPKNIEELHSRAVEGLLGAWDSFRNIARQSILGELSVRRRVILVSMLAAHLFENGKIVFSSEDIEDDFIVQLEHLLRMKNIDTDELLRTLYNDFGLLIERAPDLYSFSHLSLQEFLVANYIVDNRRELNLVSEFLYDEDWHEVIILVSRMLPKADEYLRSLHIKLDVFDKYDGNLLIELWNTDPLCTQDTKRNAVAGLVRRINPITTKYTNEMRYQKGNLVINLKTKKEQKDKKRTGKTLRRNKVNNEKSILDKDVSSSYNSRNFNLQKDFQSILVVHKILRLSKFDYTLAGVTISPFLKELNSYLIDDIERISINERKTGDNPS